MNLEKDLLAQSLLETCTARACRLTSWLQQAALRARVRRIVGLNPSTIATYTLKSELSELYLLARRCPRGSSMLEIGSHLGASALYIGAAAVERNARLYCVDTWMNQTMPEGEMDTFDTFKKNTRNITAHITMLRKHSQDLRSSDLRLPLHFAFIDGDHSHAAVRKDFETVSPWVAEGGTLAFHDAGSPHFPGVARVIGEALATGKWRIRAQRETLLCLERVP